MKYMNIVANKENFDSGDPDKVASDSYDKNERLAKALTNTREKI